MKLDHETRHTGGSRARELFELVADLPSTDREAALRLAGAGDHDVATVNHLIRSESRHRLFETPVSEWAKHLEDDEDDVESLIGKRAGPYAIVRFLGKGGSSIVFLATRQVGDAQQEVALKLLHNGLYSPDSRRRFRREQAILSKLSHPNIARLIDAGIMDSGTPFIAMEYVAGTDLITYANGRELSVRERLQLLIDVCRAVDAAHRALIVHRDLKPSNVLVTADDHVKVLDFGIAKLIDDDAPHTTTQHIALTPGYAAPEQYENAPALTSSDVYSLGVLASELLLGVRLGADAAWPSSTTSRRWRALDADLIHVLRASLASEPERRYSSAGHLADDVARYLRREPLQIVPISGWYRVRKFVARNRGGVLAASLLLAAIVSGMSAIVWQSRLVNEQATRANETRDFLVSIFKAAGDGLPRDQRPTVQDIVEQAGKRVVMETSLPDSLRADFLLTLVNIAVSEGDNENAQALLKQADIVIERLGSDAQDAALAARVVHADLDAESSLNGREKVIASLQPVQSVMLANPNAVTLDGLTTLASAERMTGRVDDALALMRRTVEASMHARSPDDRLTAMSAEVDMLLNVGRYQQAIERGRETLDEWHRQGSPTEPVVIDLLGNSAFAMEATGDTAGADENYRNAMSMADRFYERPNASIANWAVKYASFLVAQGRIDEAEPIAHRAIAIEKRLYGDADRGTFPGIAVMTRLLCARGRYAEALQWVNLAIRTCSAHSSHDMSCARMSAVRGRVNTKMGNLEDAEADIRLALDEQQAISGDDAADYVVILDSVIPLRVAQHRFHDAVDAADQALSINARRGGETMGRSLETRLYRAQALFELQRFDDALREITEIEPVYARVFPENLFVRFEMSALKAKTLERANRLADAHATADQASALIPRLSESDDALIADVNRLARARP